MDATFFTLTIKPGAILPDEVWPIIRQSIGSRFPWQTAHDQGGNVVLTFCLPARFVAGLEFAVYKIPGVILSTI